MDHRLSDPHAPSTPLTRASAFEFEVPVAVWKSDDAPEGKKRRIAGIISTDSVDRQNERILQDGLNFSDFLANGWFNDNHSGLTCDILGYPEKVQQFTANQTLPDGTPAKANCTWVEGYLLDTKKANDVWELARALAKTKRRLGYSVEGAIESRTGDDGSTIAKAKVRNVAITNCLPGHIRVTGNVQGLSRRLYDGTLVEVELAGGHTVAGTPNHPVLTQRGWVALGEVDERNDRICRFVGDGIWDAATASFAADDVQNVPPTLEEIFASCVVARGIDEVRLGNQHDFHGDGSDGDIDIVAPAGELVSRVQASFAKHFEQGLFAMPNAGALGRLAADGCFADPVGVIDAALERLTRLGRAGKPFLRASGRQLATFFSRHIASYARIFGDMPNHRVSHAIFGGEGAAGCTAGVLFGDAPVDGRGKFGESSSGGVGAFNGLFDRTQADAEADSDLAHQLSAFVQFDDIVSKVVRKFSGHVYNLEAIEGWYNANGVVTKNCAVNTDSRLEVLARSLSAQNAILRRSMTLTDSSGSQGPVKAGRNYPGDKGGGQVLSRESVQGERRKKKAKSPTNRRLSRSEAVAYVKSLVPFASEALARALVASTKFQRGRGQ